MPFGRIQQFFVGQFPSCTQRRQSCVRRHFGSPYFKQGCRSLALENACLLSALLLLSCRFLLLPPNRLLSMRNNLVLAQCERML